MPDLTKPVRVFIFDPKQHPNAFVELVSVTDAEKLKKSAGDSSKVRIDGNFALVGSATELTALAGYALGTVAKQPAPTMPAAFIFPKAILATHRGDLEGMRATFKTNPAFASMSSFFDAYVDGIIAMLDQSDSIEVRVNASADIVDLDIALLPRAGSNLGKFADAQHPSTYPLLAKLPAGRPAGRPPRPLQPLSPQRTTPTYACLSHRRACPWVAFGKPVARRRDPYTAPLCYLSFLMS